MLKNVSGRNLRAQYAMAVPVGMLVGSFLGDLQSSALDYGWGHYAFLAVGGAVAGYFAGGLAERCARKRLG